MSDRVGFVRRGRAEWFVTAPSFLWLALFFAVPAVIVLAFTFHGHDASGGVGEWSLSTWRELVDPDYPAIVWNTLRISFEVTVWSIVLAVPCAYAIARMSEAGAVMTTYEAVLYELLEDSRAPEFKAISKIVK